MRIYNFPNAQTCFTSELVQQGAFYLDKLTPETRLHLERHAYAYYSERVGMQRPLPACSVCSISTMRCCASLRSGARALLVRARPALSATVARDARWQGADPDDWSLAPVFRSPT